LPGLLLALDFSLPVEFYKYMSFGSTIKVINSVLFLGLSFAVVEAK
jgi:hypothetical protein